MSNNPLFVGIDVHRQKNAVHLMDQHGVQIDAGFFVDNNHPGTATLVQRVAQRVLDGDFDAIHIAAEATGWYWYHLLQTLSQDPLLQQWSVELYPFNPRLTAKYKQTFVDLDKTDTIDAFIIADRLRIGRDLPAPFVYDETYHPLRFLTRYRYHLVQLLAREKAYCLSILYLKASEYTRKGKQPFSDVFGAASRAVLQEFTSLEEIAAIPFDELVAYLDVKGKHSFPDPTQNARKLRRVADDSYRLPEAVQPAVNLVLTLSLKQITFLERHIKRLESAIAEHIKTIPHTLETIPGIGPVFAAGLISEIGNLERFNYDQAKVAKFAGFKWRKTQSADFEAEETKLTRTGNRYLRYYFCEAANVVRMRDVEYAAYYDRKYREVRKHQHKRAITLTARKLVRLVVRLLTTNQPYRPRRPQST